MEDSSKVEHELLTTAQYYNALRYSAHFVSEKIGDADVAVVLGSGLGCLVDTLDNPQSLEYSEIPYMPMTSVVGHGKSLYNGKVGDKKVLLWSGRVHMYEGYSSHQLTFITYLSAFLGCKYIILTNSSGGGLQGMKHGSLMVSKDHINFTAKCPIPATFNDPRFGKRNPRSSLSHSIYLKDLAFQVAKENEIELFEGNYCWTMGPSYETPLEATVLRKFGGG
jgi:purine-nucleoside phosphorylase